MKKILLLATGGTIASRPTAAGGLAPAITSEELLACVPELADLCAVDAVQVFNLDSTNVGPAQWQSIVHCIKENYDAYDGFVIAHGTDTMAYTAAALAVPALFHTFYYAFSGGRNPEVMKTEHKVMRILEQAYADKTNCFPKTRYRAITWGGPPCYWLQFPNWLYNCWGILMIAGMDLFSGNVIIDTTDEETILDGIARNYETGVMRRHLTGGWRHLVEFWDEAEKFHCDMVILHDDITCKGALGLTGVILDQAKEKTTKLMVVSNDMFDHRTISRADIRQQVNDFMFSVMQAEPLDASLLQYDDYEGW